MHDCMGFRMLRVSDPRRSDALVLRAMVSDPRHSDALVLWGRFSPCIAAWGFACCGSPTRGYSDAFVCGGGGIPMHCCMGFRMLRVSDSRHSDALVCGGFVIFAGNNEFVI